MKYHHQTGVKKLIGTKAKIVLAVLFTFMAITVAQAIYVDQQAKLPNPMTYGEIVDAKNECIKQDMTWTIHRNAKTSKVVGVTCEGMEL